jgi:hypothetical protein
VPHLADVLQRPEVLSRADDDAWLSLLEEAESTRLTGRLMREVDKIAPPVGDRAWLCDRLDSARAFSRECERAVAWEVRRLARAFYGRPWRWVLLKGAAYVAAGLPPAAGRRVADVDVLVPARHLQEAAAALADHGWHTPEMAPYDLRYYRDWMHELPPMVHDMRGSVVDLHHAILPRTSRLRADSDVLIDRAVPAGPACVLCPTHMVLHAAVHLFHDGEIAGAIRDLVDLDALLRHFNDHEPHFWKTLADDAVALGLERPTFYALRYASRLLGTPVPADTVARFATHAPALPVRSLMDRLVERTLTARDTTRGSASAFALFVRSHWLRMPPPLLVRHVFHKVTGL